MKLKNWLVEFVGMFFVGAAVVLSQQSWTGRLGVLLPGLALLFGIGLTGGHLNPVVTLTAAIGDVITLSDMFVRWFGQFLGAMIGGIAVGFFTFVKAPDLSAHVGAIQSNFFEGLFALILVLIVAETVMIRKWSPWSAGIGVGVWVIFAGLLFGPITGAVLNPAVAAMLALGDGEFGKFWNYIFGHLAAGVLIGLLVDLHLAYLAEVKTVASLRNPSTIRQTPDPMPDPWLTE